MAVVTKKELVCDIGLEKCDNAQLHRARVTMDGKTRSWVLCVRHAKPLLPFMDNAQKARSRSKIYTVAEIRAEARRAKKA